MIEVQKVQEGQEADPLGVDLTLDLIQGLKVWLVHILDLGHLRLDLIHEINTVIIHSLVGRHQIFLIPVMMEDTPKESSDPMGGKIVLQIKSTEVALRRHLAVNTNLQVKESIMKVDHL